MASPAVRSTKRCPFLVRAWENGWVHSTVVFRFAQERGARPWRGLVQRLSSLGLVPLPLCSSNLLPRCIFCAFLSSYSISAGLLSPISPLTCSVCEAQSPPPAQCPRSTQKALIPSTYLTAASNPFPRLPPNCLPSFALRPRPKRLCALWQNERASIKTQRTSSASVTTQLSSQTIRSSRCCTHPILKCPTSTINLGTGAPVINGTLTPMPSARYYTGVSVVGDTPGGGAPVLRFSTMNWVLA